MSPTLFQPIPSAYWPTPSTSVSFWPLGLIVLIGADALLAAGSPVMTFAGVALWGLHMGLTQGLLATLVAETSPDNLRGTAFGLFNLLTGAAVLVSSAIAGALWTTVGPAATFLSGAGFAGLAILLLWLLRKPLIPFVRLLAIAATRQLSRPRLAHPSPQGILPYRGRFLIIGNRERVHRSRDKSGSADCRSDRSYSVLNDENRLALVVAGRSPPPAAYRSPDQNSADRQSAQGSDPASSPARSRPAA